MLHSEQRDASLQEGTCPSAPVQSTSGQPGPSLECTSFQQRAHFALGLHLLEQLCFSSSIAVMFAPFKVVGREEDSAWVHSLRDAQNAVTGIIVHRTVSQVKMNADSSRLNKISSCKWRQHRRDPCEVSRHRHLQWKCSFSALGKLQVCMWRLCSCFFQPHSQEEDHTGSASYQPARKNLPCDAWDHTPSFPGGSLCLWVVRSIITITRYELWLCFFFPPSVSVSSCFLRAATVTLSNV